MSHGANALAPARAQGTPAALRPVHHYRRGFTCHVLLRHGPLKGVNHSEPLLVESLELRKVELNVCAKDLVRKNLVYEPFERKVGSEVARQALKANCIA